MKRNQLFAFGIALITGSAVMTGSTAHAHPGHGTDLDASGLTHHLTAPVHLAAIVGSVAVLLAVAGAWTAFRRTRVGNTERVIL